MVAKLAEQGKLSLADPVAKDAPSLKLPGGNQVRATVADVLSHRLGLYRNAYDNKLEEGQNAKFLRSTLFQLSSTCAPGTCWSYQNVAYDAASEMVERATGMPYGEAVKRTLFDPIGMASASVSRAGLENAKTWARPHGPGRRWPMNLSGSWEGLVSCRSWLNPSFEVPMCRRGLRDNGSRRCWRPHRLRWERGKLGTTTACGQY